MKDLISKDGQVIKFTRHAITVGKDRYGVMYYLSTHFQTGEQYITVSVKDYNHLPECVSEFFTVNNNTDSQSDYFDNDRIRVDKNHPYFTNVAIAYSELLQTEAKRRRKKYGIMSDRVAYVVSDFNKLQELRYG